MELKEDTIQVSFVHVHIYFLCGIIILLLHCFQVLIGVALRLEAAAQQR